LVLIGVFVGLATGNLWIYPKGIAQGWDTTLAHLPYYSLRKKMINFLETEKIPLTDVGTVFPNIGPLEIYELNGESEGFVRKDFVHNPYIFYSTVFNDFSDEELVTLEKNWLVKQRYAAFGIEVVLYRNPNIGSIEPK
ncbi:MAG: hypothetical protein AAF960_25490, partial [Bacteroidota bacterium]